MNEKVSVTFLRDMNSWEGLFPKGTTHLCELPMAEALAVEGYVTLSPVAVAPVESAPVEPAPAASRKSRSKNPTSNQLKP